MYYVYIYIYVYACSIIVITCIIIIISSSSSIIILHHYYTSYRVRPMTGTLPAVTESQPPPQDVGGGRTSMFYTILLIP